MAEMINNSNLEKEEYLNKRYGIESFPYSEDDLALLRSTINTKMAENISWKTEWADDHLMKRFLRTFVTVQETTTKLIQYFEWRLNEGIDDINFDDPVMKDILALGVNLILDDNYDSCGRPIMIIHTARQYKDNERAEQLFKTAIYFIERMCERCDKTELRQFCVVFDLSNFTMANMDFQFLQRYINCLKDYYPERIGAALVINYPSIIYPLWKVIKLWMNRHLRSKFIFCGEKEFSDFIDITKLSVRLFSSE